MRRTAFLTALAVVAFMATFSPAQTLGEPTSPPTRASWMSSKRDGSCRFSESRRIDTLLAA